METKTPTTLSTEQPDQPKLTNADVTAAATNSPALAGTFTFGGRSFPVLDLDYDSYLEFMAYLQPLLEGVAGKFAKMRGITLPDGINLPSLEEGGFGMIMKFCKKDLPEMTALVCNQEAIHNEQLDKKVTTAWIKKNAKTPFELVGIVMKQIDKNKMITDFANFFVQIFPMITAATSSEPQTPPSA